MELPSDLAECFLYSNHNKKSKRTSPFLSFLHPGNHCEITLYKSYLSLCLQKYMLIPH